MKYAHPYIATTRQRTDGRRYADLTAEQVERERDRDAARRDRYQYADSTVGLTIDDAASSRFTRMVRERTALDTGALTQAAIHEAGHAVIARALGHTVHSVKIERNGGGRTDTAHDRDDIEGALTTALAGVDAEELFGLPVDDGPGPEGDAEQIRGYVRQLSDVDIAAASSLSRTLVARHADAIDRLAAELIRRRELTGAEVDDVIGPIGPPKTETRMSLSLRPQWTRGQTLSDGSRVVDVLTVTHPTLGTYTAPVLA